MTPQDDRRTFGQVVRSLRERAGRTRPEFARACRTAESHLRNIENGHKSPGADLLRDLEQQLGTQGLLTDLARSRGAPMRRRIILQSLALMGATIAEAAPDAAAASPQLAALQAMTASLRDLDNRHGGAHANWSIVAYLQNMALPMLGNTSGDERPHMFSAVAELALLAGWSAFDAGVQGAARAYFGQALDLAREAGNRALACETIIAASNRAAIAGDATEAVDAATAALAAAEDVGDAALVGEARMALAHGHALAGDEAAAAAAIVAAHNDFDRADRPDGPDWIQHVGEAWLDGRVAQCMYLLGDTANAVDAAERTVANSRPGPRGLVLNTGHSALVMFAAEEPERAARYAGDALAAASMIQSARVDEYMMRLEVAADRYSAVPEVAELQAALAAR
jgi:transcriptional regulator with XRE-family HTH domain